MSNIVFNWDPPLHINSRVPALQARIAFSNSYLTFCKNRIRRLQMQLKVYKQYPEQYDGQLDFETYYTKEEVRDMLRSAQADLIRAIWQPWLNFAEMVHEILNPPDWSPLKENENE